MENKNFGPLVSFLFGIANDCLVDVYDVGDYRKIILPMMIIRRFDAVLEPTKKAVLEMKANLDAAGILDQDEALCGVSGEAFCNSSPYTLLTCVLAPISNSLKRTLFCILTVFPPMCRILLKSLNSAIRLISSPITISSVC